MSFDRFVFPFRGKLVWLLISSQEPIGEFIVDGTVYLFRKHPNITTRFSERVQGYVCEKNPLSTTIHSVIARKDNEVYVAAETLMFLSSESSYS